MSRMLVGRVSRAGRQSGLTMIELMMAMFVLAVGAAGILILITTAMSSNGRNKADTTATMLSQLVLDQIASVPASVDTTFTVTDCAGTAWTVATTGAPPTGGAQAGAGALITGTGAIDYTQTYAAAPANYKMLYVVCGTAGRRATYEVRWNVQTLSTNNLQPLTKLVTASTRLNGMTTNTSLRIFMQPVTLRTVTGL